LLASIWIVEDSALPSFTKYLLNKAHACAWALKSLVLGKRIVWKCAVFNNPSS